jgi:hypothetical protein
MVIGSVPRLRAELESLNERTLACDDGQLSAIRAIGPTEDGDFAWAARFGLAIYLTLARQADDWGLPLKHDY